MVKRIAGELISSEATSREGTVYITDKHVYKIFGKSTNPYDQLENYKFAEARGVPVPDTCKITAPFQDGTSSSFVSGLRMTRAHGRFFQLSKGGGESILCNEISRFRNRELLRMLIRGLMSAGDIGLSDPQGFVCPDSNPPLIFIDLHFTRTPNSVTFSSAIERATIKLQELENEMVTI